MRQRLGELRKAIAILAMLIASFSLNMATATWAQPPLQTSGWSITRSSETGPVMARSSGQTTLDLRVVTDEYNMFTPTLELKVIDCGGKPWNTSDSASPVGASVTDRATRVREIAIAQFTKARSACSVTADDEARLLDGFEAAYAQFEAIRQ